MNIIITNIKLFKMSNLLQKKQLTRSQNSINVLSSIKLLALVLLFLPLQGYLNAQCFTVTKSLLGVAPATSNIPGNIDVTYRIEVVNSNCAIATGINVSEDLASVTNLGTAFVSVVGFPVIAYVSPTANGGIVNTGYTGTAVDPNLLTALGGAVLSQNDTVIYHLTVQVNPRAAGAPGVLNNTAIVTSIIPVAIPPSNSNAVALPDCWSNCQLACNNQVQVSVNSFCEAEILSAMILEGESSVCANLGFFQVTLYYNNVLVSMPLNKSFIGKKLKVNVRNIVCNNSCWGNILLEDKTPPVLNCKARDTFSCATNLNPVSFGFPVNPAFINLSVYPYVVTGLDACGSVTLTFKDSIVKYDCSNRVLSATVYRKWCAKDPGGYESCCIDTIDLQRGTIADIVLPRHYDGQPGNLPALQCNGSWTKFPNGNPDTTATGTGKPSGILCGNIQYDFSDDTLRVCPGTFKLLRRWLIIDWCDPNNRLNFIQLIKVVDDRAPAFIPPATITISTETHSCTGSYIVPVPENLLPNTVNNVNTPYVLENCSGWTYTVRHLAATDPNNCNPAFGAGDTHNVTKLADGRYRVDNMPLGCNWIYYRVCDGCGNCTEGSFDIKVEDKTPPNAVCQQKTVVALTTNGGSGSVRATVPASTFDQGSFDNCAMGKFRARRMNPSSCGNTNFADSVSFCCEDVLASPIRIVLQVIDKANNSSECMVDVIVQDKLPPHISCPRDTVVNCETDISNLNVFGSATATDNCSVVISTRVENNLTACNVGTIRRWFIATDPGGRKDSCYQTITVRDIRPFKGADITWPADITLVGCNNSTSTSITGKPVFANQDHCNQIIANSTDLTFNYVEGVCFKILRKWTVIDWCTYDVRNPVEGVGLWYHTQVIKINNTQAPTFTSSCADRDSCIRENCNVQIRFTASATDDCTMQDELIWTYQLDRDNNGTIDQTGSSRSFLPNTNLTAGTHRITFTVSDQCGNKSTCTYLQTVHDCKLPTPYCLTGIVTVIMPNNGQVTIWAKDFNLASTDNCTPNELLRYSFTSNIADSFKVIRCADLDNGRVDTFDVDMYVFDKENYFDLCHTKLIVQDNQNACPDNLSSGMVSGLIYVSNNNIADLVPVQCQNLVNSEMRESVTTNNGTYAFENLTMQTDYVIKPLLNTEPLKGVSTKDIVKIQKHILGIESLTDPYKLIAADVNFSKSITAKDISDIRKLILGVTPTFQNSPSWTFVDAGFKFDPSNPFDFPNFIKINQMSKPMLENNFVAVKIGDVTGEANTGSLNVVGQRTNEICGFEMELSPVELDQEIRIPFYTSTSWNEVEGMQFELGFDANVLSFERIESNQIVLDQSNYKSNNGSIRMSWSTNVETNIVTTEPLFYLVFTGKINGELNPNVIQLHAQNMAPEFYTNSTDANITLLLRNKKASSATYELYQNIPNPFSGKTTIYYRLPADESVKLSIFDLSGKLIESNYLTGKKGVNSAEVNINPSQSGVLYYQLDTKEFIATRKMVVIR